MAKQAWFVGVLVVASSLAACGSGSDAEPIATVTPTPLAGSPSAAPSPTPAVETPTSAPVMPDQARENTPEGAEAFTAHWFNAMNWANTAQDTEPLRLLSADGCEFCAKAYEGVEAERSLGATQEGGLIAVRDIQYREDMLPGQPMLELSYQEEPGRVVLPDGSLKSEWVGLPPTRREVLLAWVGDGWVLRAFGETIRCVDCA